MANRKGRPNRKKLVSRIYSHGKIRAERLEIRASQGLVEGISFLAEKEKCSKADIIHIAIQHYGMSRYYVQGEVFKLFRDEIL